MQLRAFVDYRSKKEDAPLIFKRQTLIGMLAFSLCWAGTAAAANLAEDPAAQAPPTAAPANGSNAEAVDWTLLLFDAPADIRNHWSEPL